MIKPLLVYLTMHERTSRKHERYPYLRKHRIATKTKIKALTDTHINITTLIHTLREQRRISIKLQLELLRVICKVP
jgi:hypothetical protein